MAHGLTGGLNNCLVILDPLDQMTEVPPQRIMEALGLIPNILCTSVHDSFKERAEYGYPFFYKWRTCGEKGAPTVTEDGVYKYEGDTDLQPMATFLKGEDVAYAYDYGIVVVSDPKNEGKFLTTRMD